MWSSKMNTSYKNNDRVAYDSLAIGSLLLEAAESIIGHLNDRHPQSRFLSSSALLNEANEMTSNCH